MKVCDFIRDLLLRETTIEYKFVENSNFESPTVDENDKLETNLIVDLNKSLENLDDTDYQKMWRVLTIAGYFFYKVSVVERNIDCLKELVSYFIECDSTGQSVLLDKRNAIIAKYKIKDEV